VISMLPENQKELEFNVRVVKRNMDELLDYIREGSYDAGEGTLYYLSDLMFYLIDLLKSDQAGRVAESWNDWVERRVGEEVRRARQMLGMFSK
jgi:hypothetical protein